MSVSVFSENYTVFNKLLNKYDKLEKKLEKTMHIENKRRGGKSSKNIKKKQHPIIETVADKQITEIPPKPKCLNDDFNNNYCICRKPEGPDDTYYECECCKSWIHQDFTTSKKRIFKKKKFQCDA